MTAVRPLGPSLHRPKPSLPRHLVARETREAARFSWRWFRARHLPLAATGLVWNAVMATICVKVLTAPEQSAWGLLFLSPHLGAGLWMLYYTLASALNRTTIDVSRERLTIRHGPLPWPGVRDLDLPGHSLKQLYCEAWMRKPWMADLSKVVYDLNALDASGQKVELVPGIENRNQVLYLELALEKQLGIEDALVEGEAATRIPA